MTIYETADKRAHLPLLFLADESERMIARYLDRGTMFVLDDGGIRAEVVVCDAGSGTIEIKNIAVLPEFQRRGYGRALIDFVCSHYKSTHSAVFVGTGDSPLTVPFYESCGFARSHIVPGFFTRNYDHPIYECGVLLDDMVYLKKSLLEENAER